MAQCNGPAPTKGQLYTHSLFHFSQFSVLFLYLSDMARASLEMLPFIHLEISPRS